MKIGAVVLCGGKSSRMGREKALLEIKGKTFLQHILDQLQGFEEILLSVSKTSPLYSVSCRTITDCFPDCGPMGGLQAALSDCHCEALLAVSCDLPFFDRALAELLLAQMTPQTDAVIPVTPDGRYHPACAVYRRTVEPTLVRYLEQGDYKLRHVLRELSVQYVSVSGPMAECLKNVNTPEEYLAISSKWSETE